MSWGWFSSFSQSWITDTSVIFVFSSHVFVSQAWYTECSLETFGHKFTLSHLIIRNARRPKRQYLYPRPGPSLFLLNSTYDPFRQHPTSFEPKRRIVGSHNHNHGNHNHSHNQGNHNHNHNHGNHNPSQGKHPSPKSPPRRVAWLPPPQGSERTSSTQRSVLLQPPQKKSQHHQKSSVGWVLAHFFYIKKVSMFAFLSFPVLWVTITSFIFLGATVALRLDTNTTALWWATLTSWKTSMIIFSCCAHVTCTRCVTFWPPALLQSVPSDVKTRSFATGKSCFLWSGYGNILIKYVNKCQSQIKFWNRQKVTTFLESFHKGK